MFDFGPSRKIRSKYPYKSGNWLKLPHAAGALGMKNKLRRSPRDDDRRDVFFFHLSSRSVVSPASAPFRCSWHSIRVVITRAFTAASIIASPARVLSDKTGANFKRPIKSTRRASRLICEWRSVGSFYFLPRINQTNMTHTQSTTLKKNSLDYIWFNLLVALFWQVKFQAKKEKCLLETF